MLRTRTWQLGRALRRRGVALSAALAFASLSAGSPAMAAAKQRSFSSPQQAVDALVDAARAGRAAALVHIFGPGGRKLVYSGDPVADKDGRERFVASYDEMHRIDSEDGKATLVIGKDEWPFPVPLLERKGAWRFDTKSGEQEILDRRIGRNELSAIEVSRAYVDAQRDYSSKDRDGDGLREYAQKFMSSPGKHDGLYWAVKAGEEESPIGPLVAEAHAEGYGAKGSKGSPYHGYYYRILTRQGSHAPGGAYNYVAHGHMIGGFALVAFPAKYGDSGVMTFIVNQDGIVYQKNLGRETATIARRMTAFDPDSSWQKVQ